VDLLYRSIKRPYALIALIERSKAEDLLYRSIKRPNTGR